MAWTEQCKVAFRANCTAKLGRYKNKDRKLTGVLRELSKESGIPLNTLRRWWYDRTTGNSIRIRNDTDKSKSRAIVEPTKIYHSGRGGVREGAGRKPQKSKVTISIEQQQYILALEKCLLALPKNPPEIWDIEPLSRAAAYAEIIIKRLSVFDELTAKAQDSLSDGLVVNPLI